MRLPGFSVQFTSPTFEPHVKRSQTLNPESTWEFSCTEGSEPRLKPGALSSRRKLPGTCMGDDAFTAVEKPTAGRKVLELELSPGRPSASAAVDEGVAAADACSTCVYGQC